MSEGSLQVIMATFPDGESASDALENLSQRVKDGEINIVDAAVIEKDMDEKIHVNDTGDVSTGKGAAIGGIIGGVLGLIAGPAGAVILGGTGAVIGGALTRGDEGMSDESLREIGEGLKSGTSAVIAIVEEVWVKEVETYLAKSANDVTVQTLSAEILKQLVDDTD